ncbi:hypothetical protein JOC70_003079 [Clostridium pascui]|uniref:DUF3006 domain-containing protein n=1 Tax=Clostridium pascui TaxID=46609 RepID=UPI0019596E3A|nr:DUF3006 domain-containing protein [Clostridium pascui]MBM7871579.1 hypothetical protein [Clostridium pascui]
MKVIIDRFEEDFAVCERENKTMLDIPKEILPEEAKEGDVLNINISIDTEETESRKKLIQELTKDIWS